MNRTTKSIAALNASAAPVPRSWTEWLGRREGQGPVRPMAVVVINEDTNDMLEMLAAEDKQPIETLGANGSHELLSHAVGLRGAKRRPNDLNPVASEHSVKTVREFLISVANQEADAFRTLRQGPGQLPGLLGDPCRARIRCASGEMHTAAAQLNKEEHVDGVFKLTHYPASEQTTNVLTMPDNTRFTECAM